jgi:hypothetical protein
MTDQTILRHAAKLTPGDRIAAGFLPSSRPARVVFVHHYVSPLHEDDWVFVVHQDDSSGPDSDYWMAGAQIPLESTADDMGLAYSRADSDADDPTPVSPARVPLHTGSVVADGVLVTDDATS